MVGMSLLQPNNWRMLHGDGKAYVIFAPWVRMHLFASFGWWLGNMQDFMPDAVLCGCEPKCQQPVHENNTVMVAAGSVICHDVIMGGIEILYWGCPAAASWTLLRHPNLFL